MDNSGGQEAAMANKARKKSAAKEKNVRRAKATAKVKAKPKSKTKIKSATVSRSKAVRKTSPKVGPKGIAEKIASSFQMLVDTIKETDALRNKMGRPGTSETT
jgi:hypothetical protein